MSRTFSAAQRKDIAEAQQHASELLDLFRAWVPKRRATVRQLRDIASELRSVSQGVNAGRFVGTLICLYSTSAKTLLKPYLIKFCKQLKRDAYCSSAMCEARWHVLFTVIES